MSADRLPAIGTLTDRIGIERKHETGDGAGGRVTAFLEIGRVWARVRALRPGFWGGAEGRTARGTHTAVLRFRADLKPGDRLNYRGRTLEIVGAEDVNGRRAFLSCTCVETTVSP